MRPGAKLLEVLVIGILVGGTVGSSFEQRLALRDAHQLVYAKPLSGWHPTCCVAALVALHLGDVQYAEGCSR